MAALSVSVVAQPAAGSTREPQASGVTSAASPSKIFGPGVAIDAKANRRVTGRMGLAYRFRAATSSRALAILFQPKWGSGYSLGNGGRYRISLQANGAGAAPSGRVLASFTWTPGNRGSQGLVRRFTFPEPPLLRKGRIYHIVFENTHDRPDDNYISINGTFTYAPLAPRHPRFRDGTFAVLNGTRTSGSSRSWAVDTHLMANMDLVYADGKHQGLAYLAAMGDKTALISGSRMVRERFTVPGRRRLATGACVRIGRQRGSGPLTITLETAAGRALATEQGSTSQVARTTPGQLGGAKGDWVCVDFGRAVALRKGQAYALRLSAPSDLQFSMTPILARDHSTDSTGYHMESYYFRSGLAQRSSDGGRTWSAIYQSYPNNMQFYLSVR